MKRVFIFSLILIGIVGVLYITKGRSKQISPKEAQTMYSENKDFVVLGGQYESYKLEKLTFAREGRVVLFFNASWCETCSGFEDELKQFALPENVLLLSVDFDQNQDLRKKYGVALQHTFIEVDGEGNVLKRWSGGGIEKFKKELQLVTP